MANYIVNGIIKSLPPNPKSTTGLTILKKKVREELDGLNVPYVDPCCIEGLAYGTVRMDIASGNQEYFNGTAWVEVPTNGGAATGATAFAGGGQGSAVQLTPGFTELTVVATAGDSVKLPAAAISTTVTIKNEGAAAADVFPFTGDTINDGAANAAIRIVPGATITFVAISATNWETNSETVQATKVSNPAGTLVAGFYPLAAQDDIAAGAGGAISITTYLTTINTDAGGDAFTLANSTQTGQRKKIRLVVDGGGDGVVTPTSLSGGTTITFNDANDYVELIWSGTAWVVLENSGTTVESV